jgi:hypothetical protein
MTYFIAELNHKNLYTFYRLFVYKDETIKTISIDGITAFSDIHKLVKRLSSSSPNNVTDTGNYPVKITNKFSKNLFDQYENCIKFNSIEEIINHYPEYLI